MSIVEILQAVTLLLCVVNYGLTLYGNKWDFGDISAVGWLMADQLVSWMAFVGLVGQLSGDCVHWLVVGWLMACRLFGDHRNVDMKHDKDTWRDIAHGT